MSNIRKDSDLIADVIWWIRGYIAGNPDSGYFSSDHISALMQAKISAEKVEEKDLEEVK